MVEPRTTSRPTAQRTGKATAAPSADWSALADPCEESAFFEGWLTLQSKRIEGVRASLLVVPSGDAPDLRVVAAWPAGDERLANLERLAGLAHDDRQITASTSGEAAVSGIGPPGELLIAVPLGADRVTGVVAVAVAPQRAPAAPERIAADLRWGAGWLASVSRARDARDAEGRAGAAAACLDLMNAVGGTERVDAMAVAAVNHLATALTCDRVSLGLLRRRGTIRLTAISHSARFRAEAGLVDAIENAMEEAADQRASVAVPALEGTRRALSLASRALAEGQSCRDARVLTLVLPDGAGGVSGALTLERHGGEPFDARMLRTVEAMAVLLGPAISRQRRADRWLSGRLVDLPAAALRAVSGPGRPALKLAAAGALGLLAYLALATGDHRVTAPAVLEPAEQRAAVAPFDGFIGEALVRAGDKVRRGDVLARLDDRDLVLERLRLQNERAKLRQKQTEALAAHDRTALGVLAAQMRQAEAALFLAESRLARARIEAPFDGLVVQGDLSQSLGAPVEKGDVLFEVAPDGAFRLIVKVEQGDASYIAVGQSGIVSLAGAPDRELPLEITRIMPVTVAADGRNALEVEARLLRSGAALRPGMEGVAKIGAGERRLLWIWFHGLADAVRLAGWKYLP